MSEIERKERGKKQDKNLNNSVYSEIIGFIRLLGLENTIKNIK